MKNSVGRVLNTLLIFMILVSMSVVGGCSQNIQKTVTSVESIELSNSWHGGESLYELKNTDGLVEIKYYAKFFGDEHFENEGFDSAPKKAAVCSEDVIVELLNNSDVIKWDGFSSSNIVLDGTSFSFTAYVNNGQKIYASGHEDFPDGYNGFLSGLNEILDDEGEKETTVPDDKITSIDFAVLSLSWVDGAEMYDIKSTENGIEVRYYEDEYYQDKGFVTEHKKTLVYDTEEFIEFLNANEALSWDGFYDESTYDRVGAITYEFAAVVNDEKTINAYGVDSIPVGIDELHVELYKAFRDAEEIIPSVDTLAPEDTVTSIESLKLSSGAIFGTGGRNWYEITNTDGEITLSHYMDVYYEDEGKVTELQKSVVCDAEKIIELMNTSRVMTWDGFVGYNPPNMLDGGSFSLTAVVNGGKEITASGYNNYPIGYSKFYSGLYKMLNGEDVSEQ